MLKSIINWLVGEARNTKFFHTSTLNRRRRNNISSPQKDGTLLYSQPKIKEAIIFFYTTLFTTRHLSAKLRCQSNPSNFCSISSSNHSILDSIPSMGEVRNVVFSFKPFKAPGPNGMLPFMYQKYWDTMAPLLSDFRTSTFTFNSIDSRTNSTYICFILKWRNASSKEFQEHWFV